ncbi:helix-turn-helix domain-containing protein [Nocardia puris]|uniref:helix-turn-helix domain-containing protein n=1 Tax=Nocardia puris TaxID=208602 RepID=UPI002E1B530D
MTTPRELLTVAEVAERYGVSTRTVRNWVDSGHVPAYRIGPRLIKLDAVEVDAALLVRATGGSK